MFNNRAWHQEVMHLERMAARRERDADRAKIGTLIEKPYIDFGKLAESLGVHGEGPITDPTALAPALARAIKVVKSGRPALVDVVCQGR
jgi:acetolactate synthase I/II/III large subunit